MSETRLREVRKSRDPTLSVPINASRKVHFHRLLAVAASRFFSSLSLAMSGVNSQVNACAHTCRGLYHRATVSSSREIEMHVAENSDIMFRVTFALEPDRTDDAWLAYAFSIADEFGDFFFECPIIRDLSPLGDTATRYKCGERDKKKNKIKKKEKPRTFDAICAISLYIIHTRT